MSASDHPDSAAGTRGRWLLVAVSMVAAVVVAAALFVTGPPSAQRELKLDARRVEDLSHIVASIERYAKRSDALPPDLETLTRQPGEYLVLVDPIEGSPYDYKVTGERSYRLCATFTTDTAAAGNRRYSWHDGDWNHGAGRHCFDRRLPIPRSDHDDAAN